MWPYYTVGITSGFLWGLNDILTNLLSNSFHLNSIAIMLLFSACLALLQDLLSSLAIISTYLLQGQWHTQWKKISSARHIMMLSAVCSGPLGLLCSILAIENIGAVYAGAITAAYPLVTLVGSRFYLKESLSKWRIIGVIIGVIAVALIGLQGATTTTSPHRILGLCFALVSLFGWGMESVFFSRAYTRTQANSSSLLALRQLYSSLCYVVILCAVAVGFHHNLQVSFNLFSFPLLVVGCIISAGFSYLTYYFSIKMLSASIGTLFNVTFIFWSALIGVLIGLVMLSWWFWCCAVLLFTGVVLALKH